MVGSPGCGGAGLEWMSCRGAKSRKTGTFL